MIRKLLPTALGAVAVACLSVAVLPAVRAQDSGATSVDGTSDDGIGTSDGLDPSVDPSADSTDPSADPSSDPSADPSSDPSADGSDTSDVPTDDGSDTSDVPTDDGSDTSVDPTAADATATAPVTSTTTSKKKPVRPRFLANGFPDVRGVGKFANGTPLLAGFKFDAQGRPVSLTEGKTKIAFKSGKPQFTQHKNGHPVCPEVGWNVHTVPYFAGVPIYLETTAGEKVGCAPGVIYERGGLPAGFASIVPPQTQAEIDSDMGALRSKREARKKQLETEVSRLEALVATTKKTGETEAVRALEAQLATAKQKLAHEKVLIARVPVDQRRRELTATLTRTTITFLKVEANAHKPVATPKGPKPKTSKTTPAKKTPAKKAPAKKSTHKTEGKPKAKTPRLGTKKPKPEPKPTTKKTTTKKKTGK